MLTDAETCQEDRFWLHAAKFMVIGPLGTQIIGLPLHVVVDIEIEGWGFDNSNSIRMIGLAQTCRESNHNPDGVNTYRLGCPGINGTGCRKPAVKEYVHTFVDTGNSTGVYISGIEINEYNTTLLFDGNIVQFLDEGDAITIEPGTVLFSGRPSNNWTASERNTMAKLTGVYEYADDPNEFRFDWNRVNYVYRAGGTVDSNKLSLPIGWPMGQIPQIDFVNGRGVWVRRNKLRTRREFLGVESAGMKICFAVNDGGLQKHYSEGGSLYFIEPPAMDDAGVKLTSQVIGSVAPVIVSFSPRRSNPNYNLNHDEPIVLRILWQDVDSMLEPLISYENTNNSLEPLPPDAEVAMENATQALCGQMFLEMWTNDALGFPLPRGCYYGRTYKNEPDSPTQVTPTYREYFIIFEPNNGLKSLCLDSRFNNRQGSCAYMLVLNARVGLIVNTNVEVATLHTKCAEVPQGEKPRCGSKHSVMEWGAGRASKVTLPAEDGSAQLDYVEIGPWGSLRGEGMPSFWDLNAERDPNLRGYPWKIEVRAWVQNQSNPITRSSMLRLFLSPFGVWDLGLTECTAICVPPENFTCSDGRGGSDVICRKMPVTFSLFDGVVRMPRNMIELKYPRRMDVLNGSLFNITDEHVLEVSNLLMPSQGFFPTRFLVQLTDETELNPSIVFTNQTFRRLPPTGATVGRILIDGQIGSGPKPFVGERSNPLFLYLSLGVTLKHDASSDNGPVIEIILPGGYTCLITGDGSPDPDQTMQLFKLDRNNDGYLDYFRGALKMGSWGSEGGTCYYKLAPLASLTVGTDFYVQIEVHNPQFSFARTNPLNKWRIQLKGMDGAIFGGMSEFVSLDEELQYPEWVGNLAVIEPLDGECMQPSSFALGVRQELTLFFKAVHSMPVSSLLYLDAPTGFDFNDECIVGDARSETYADFLALPWGEDLVGERSKTRRLGGVTECIGDVWGLDPFAAAPKSNFTRAKIRLAGPLLSEAYYAFTIRVRNAHFYETAQQNGWTLWVMSPQGYPVDGSRYTIQFNEARVATVPPANYDRTWGLYEQSLRLPLTLNFGSSLVLPTPDNLITQQVVIYPLETTYNTFVNLRVIAPVGYRWDVFRKDGLHGDVPGVTCARCRLIIADPPQIKFYNELLINQLVFRAYYKYGIRARIFIPSSPPTRSVNAFYIEMGYNKENEGDRLQASALPSPKLRAVFNAFVFSLCNAAKFAANLIEFHMHTVSDLYYNQGFIFRGDEATRGMELLCFPTAAYDTMAIPQDIQCSIFQDSLTNLLVVTLSSFVTPLRAGHWGFSFHSSSNVPDAVETGGFWLLGTYSNINQFPDVEVVDQAVRVPAPGTLATMRMAGYLTPPEWEAPAIGRLDQPGVMNSIIFYFILTERLVVPPKFPTITVALRGPRGFFFEENCLFGVEVLNGTDGVEANETNETWPCRYNSSNENETSWCPILIQDWPDALQVDACLGIGNTAKILLKNDGMLEAGVPYGIKVSMTNPRYGLTSDLWAIDVGPEASKPIPSFTVRTFDVTQTFLQAASPAVLTQQTALINGMPISVVFTPSADVPAAMAGTRRLQETLSTLPMDQAAQEFWFYYPDDAVEGSLVLEAPFGYEIGISYVDRLDDACDRSSLEVYNRDPNDREAEFRDPEDVYCNVEGARNRSRMRFIGKKTLQANVRYRLILMVMNPYEARSFEPWVLRTEKTLFRTLETIQLDRIVLPGYEVSVSFPQWLIENLSDERNGGFTVRRIKITIVFNKDLMDGDTLEIFAPTGFRMLEGSAANSSCMNFQYATVLLPLLDTPPPTCFQDDNGESRLIFYINEGQPDGVALERGRSLEFLVGAINPISTPDIVQNNWRAYHRGTYRATDDGSLSSLADRVDQTGYLFGVGVIGSWDVIAPMWNISVQISGRFSRSGSISDLSIEFTPTRWSTILELEIHEPKGFIFDNAEVHHPYLVDSQTGGDRLVLRNGSFLAFQTVRIIVSKVRLAITGGPTRMDFAMFETRNLRDDLKKGGRLNYILGFRQPGALNIHSHQMLSEPVVAHYEQNQTDAVLPLLPTRVGEIARVELTFSITMPLNIGERLVLTSVNESGKQFIGLVNEPQYRPSLARCKPDQLTGPNAAAHSTCDVESDINITFVELVKDRMAVHPHAIRLTLDHIAEDPLVGITTPPPGSPVLPVSQYVNRQGQPVLTDIVYRLRVWCYPTFDASFWKLETEDGNPMPANTNDGITSAIRAVYPMDFVVDAIRTPPASMVPATLDIPPGPYPPGLSRLEVVLPLQYQEHLAEELVTFKSTGRVVATIDLSESQQAEIASSGSTVEPRVITPGATGSDPRWFLLSYAWDASIPPAGRNMTNAEMVGWGYAAGWTINQLNVSIAYGTIASFRGSASLYFSVPIKANGTTAVITAPRGFNIACPDKVEGMVERPCSSVRYQRILFPDIHSTVNLTLSAPSVEGAFLVYSFIIKVQTPISAPASMTWDVRVFDSHWSIVDAAIGVQKPDFVEGMWITSPFFTWSSAPVAGEASTATVQFSMTRRVRNVKALLITLPEGYRHDIVHKNQFKSLSKKFPAAIDVEWRNYDNLRWLRILVARPASAELDFIPGGTYRFEFPVMVPIIKPLATEWYLALCSSYACDSVTPPDSNIIVYFPMPMTASVGTPIDYTPGALSDAEFQAPCYMALQVILAVAWLLRPVCAT